MTLEDKIRDFAARFDSPNTAAGVLDMIGKQMDTSEGLADKLGATFKAAGGEQPPAAGNDGDIAPDFDQMFEGNGEIVSADRFMAAVSQKAAETVGAEVAQLGQKVDALMAAISGAQSEAPPADPPTEDPPVEEPSETDAMKEMISALESQVKEMQAGVPPMTGIGQFRQTEKGAKWQGDVTANGAPVQYVDPLITDTYGQGQWSEV